MLQNHWNILIGYILCVVSIGIIPTVAWVCVHTVCYELYVVNIQCVCVADSPMISFTLLFTQKRKCSNGIRNSRDALAGIHAPY